MDKRILRLTLAALALGCVASATATEKTYTYVGDAPMVYYPTNRPETSHLAMKLDNPGLKGKKIKGVKVKVNNDGQTITNPQIWLSSDLLLEKNVDGLNDNAPDILCVDGVIDADGWMEVTFSDPYELTGAPLYVGYSITVPEYNRDAKAPITYSQSRHEGGFYYYSYLGAVRWMDYQEKLLGVLPIYVTIEGDFGDCELSPEGWDTDYPYAQIDKTFSLPMRVWNTGNQPVESFKYSYKSGDYAGEGEFVADGSLPSNLTDPYIINLPFEAISQLGKYNVEFEITEVNGQNNQAVAPAATLPVECRRLVPVRRTVLEEATGTWCTACTRGIAAINELHRLYGDRFIAMAYHAGKDPMFTDSDVPFEIPHFPSAVLDRGDVIDPYYGDDNSQTKHFRIEPMVKKVLDSPAAAAVDIKSEWTSDDRSQIKAEVTVEFIQPLEGKKHSLAIALLANGLKGEEPFWWQYNSLGHGEGGNTPEMLEWLVEAGNPIKDMVFDHVVVYHYDADRQSVSPTLDAFTPESHEFTIDLAKAVSIYELSKGLNLIQNKDNLDIVALLLDENGKVINANQAAVGIDTSAADSNGVDSILDAGDVKAVEFFDLTGRRLMNPERGIIVKRTIFNNGQTKTEKIIKR